MILIHWLNLKQTLLSKAISLIKDRTGLVGVIRNKIHHKTNKPYTQLYWIRPEEVQDNDKVVAGHHNLPAGHAQKLATFALNTKMSPEVRAVSDFYAKLFPNRNDFFKSLKSYAITWVDASTTAKPGTKQSVIDGLNLMRAKMGLNVAVLAGWNPPGVPQSLIDAARASMTVQAPAFANPNNRPQPQQIVSSVPVSGINLPNKAKKASQASKDKVTEFFNSLNVDKMTFAEIVKSMGIVLPVVKNNHEGITFMRAKEMLALHIENGFDVDNAWKLLQQTDDDSAEVEPDEPIDDSSTIVEPTLNVEPPDPNTPESMLDIPEDATPDERIIIESINKMTNETEIKQCAIMGIVPEDDIAKDYVINTQLASLINWVENGKPCDAINKIAPQFRIDMEKFGFELGGVNGLPGLLFDLPKGFTTMGMQLTRKLMGIVNFNKDTLRGILEKVFDPHQTQLDGSIFVTPNKFVNIPGSGDNTENYAFNIIKSLNDAFSDYTLDDSDPLLREWVYAVKRHMVVNSTNTTNIGYSGFDPQEYKKRYNLEKEGFVRYLRKIQSDNKDDQDISNKVESMIKDYDEIMKLVGGNYQFLLDVVSKKTWDTTNALPFTGKDFGLTNWFSVPNAATARRLIEIIDKQSDLVINTLVSRGYATKDILYALSNSYDNDDLRKFIIFNAQTNKLERIDFSEMFDREDEKKWSTSALYYTLYKFKIQENISLDYKSYNREESPHNIMATYNYYKQYAEFSVEDYKKVNLLINKLFGIDQVNGDDWNPAKQSQTTRQWITKDLSPAETVILSNVLMARIQHQIHTQISMEAQESTRSAANKRGDDFSGNFDYYSGTVMPAYVTTVPSARYKQVGNAFVDSACYTPQQISDKITQQLNNAFSFTKDYINSVNQTYAAVGAVTGRTPDVVGKLNKIDMRFEVEHLMNDPSNPMKDVLFNIIADIDSHLPSVASKPNWKKNLIKRMGYAPFVIGDNPSPEIIEPPPNTTTPESLKSARQALLDRSMGSIYTENPDVSREKAKDVIDRFDYEDGESTPDGTVIHDKRHSGPDAQYDQRVLFNSRFFGIRSPLWEKRYMERKEKMKAQGLDEFHWKDWDLFHGCSRAAGGSILGRDKAWYMNGEVVLSGTMNGFGAYFGYKAGKSSVYVGDIKYASRSYGTPPPGAADGILMEAYVMRGEDPGPYYNSTSYSDDASARLNDWEMVVRDNALILPHHFVDVSCRTLGRNIIQDNDGNYLDEDGNVAYHSNGISVNLDY